MLSETEKKVVGHPLFPKLVREVAVAEQPNGIPHRYRMNSRTFGLWVTRGAKRIPRKGHRHYSERSRRAYLFAEQIAKDTGIFPDSPEKNYAMHFAYVTARYFVYGRSRGVVKVDD